MIKAQAKKESQTQSELKPNLFASPVRVAGVGLTKTDAQATYGLCYGRSTYRQKSKEITFPTHLVPHLLGFGVDRKLRRKLTFKIYQGAATPVVGLECLVRPRVARPPPCPTPI